MVIDYKEDNKTLDQDSSVTQLQSSNFIEMPNQMTQESFIPLCFESFQFLKEMWYKISKKKDEQLVEIYEVPFKAICNKL